MSGPGVGRSARETGLASPAAAVVILAGFWVLLAASLWNKSATTDEIVHAAAGYSYWRFDDYRLNPENGNLPQRILALPLLAGSDRFPARDLDSWRTADEWAVGDTWFYRMGNDAASLLRRGRAASALLAVALGALVWAWSRRLFGPWGGVLSLALYVLNPTVLANGGLMTSDTACALFFLAATGAFWRMLHRVSPGCVAASGLLVGALFVAKMSAILFVPIAGVLLVARCLADAPLAVTAGVWHREFRRRGARAAVLLLAVGAQAVLVGLVIWASFGFRYSTYAGPTADAGRFRDPWEHVLGLPDPVETLERLNLRDDQHRAAQAALAANGVRADAWTPEAVRALDEIRGRILTPGQVRLLDEARAAPPPAAAARFLAFLRNHRLLPEAYIYGYAASWRYAQSRSAFFNGEFSLSGWRWFFPYTFLVKTPLPFLVMLLLATGLAVGGAGAPRGRGRELAYALLPLATLWVVYWVAVIPSHVDIGHRHILATYPPLFILCGVVAEWAGRSRHRAPAAVVLALLALQAAEMAWRFPNYLAYFNSLNGGPGRAYRHLVDSSLDWGQDLPGVGTYLRKHPSAGPAYLAYLGAGSPEYYRTPAQLIYPRTQPVLILAYPAPPAAKLGEEILQAHPDYRIVAAGRREAVETVVLLKKPAALRLGAGTYFISASLLQPLGYNGPGPWGPWNDRYEARYQALAVQAKPLLEDEGPARSAAWRVRSIAEWAQILRDYDAFRFGRLTASLRRREPDDTVNFSILVYHLTDAELARALEGPTPERGRDLLRELDPSGAAPGKSAGSPLP